jgi:hypothetical protein
MSARARSCLGAACLAVIAAALTGRAGAQPVETANWNGTSGNWTNPGIWATSPLTGLFPNNGQPTGTTTYNVSVTNGTGTITLDTPITVSQLAFSTGTISGPTAGGPNLLTLSQNLGWSGGTFVGAISVLSQNAATIAAPTGQTVTLDTGAVTLNGSTTWSSGNITLLNGATLTIGGGGSTFNASGSGQIIAGGGAAGPSLTNNGVFLKTGTATTSIGTTVTNNGAFSSQAGVLQFNGQLTNNGGLAASGGGLQVAGTLTNLSSGGVLTGGAYQVSGGSTMTLPGTVSTIAANTLVQLDGTNSSIPSIAGVGTINGTFRLSNGGVFTTAGDLATSGTLDEVGSGSQLNVNGKLSVPASGTANITNGMVAVTSTTSVAGTLNVGSGATLSGSQLLTVATSGKLAVNGTVTQPITVAGILSGNAHFNNNVTIQAGGHLQPGNSPGTITISGNMNLNGNYDWDLNGNDNTMAGGTFDKTVVTGTTALDPPAVNVDFGPVLSFSDPFWTTPRTWDILDTGNFSVDTILPSITTSDTSYQTIYPNGAFALSLTNTSLNVNWFPQGVPEPSSFALAGLAVAGWASRRFLGRRKQKASGVA